MKFVVCKNYLGGQIVYGSLVPPIKNGVKGKPGGAQGLGGCGESSTEHKCSGRTDYDWIMKKPCDHECESFECCPWERWIPECNACLEAFAEKFPNFADKAEAYCARFRPCSSVANKNGCSSGHDKGRPGKNCEPNRDGSDGQQGRVGSVTSPNSNDVTQIINKQWVLDIPYILQDMLLKYAIGLQNSDQSSEAQEIYVFLQKVQNVQIRKTAEKLLTNMNNGGEMKPANELVQKFSFNEISQKLEKYLNIGSKIESILNVMGQKFSFHAMMRDVADAALGTFDTSKIYSFAP